MWRNPRLVFIEQNSWLPDEIHFDPTILAQKRIMSQISTRSTFEKL
jgi:hypothetical protein